MEALSLYVSSVGVAALLANKIDIKGKKVATVICGGNIDVNGRMIKFSHSSNFDRMIRSSMLVIALVIESGLVDSGRRVKLSINLPDRPGSLSQLMSLVSSFQANV